MSLKIDLWRDVVRAIEAAIPEYDVVNEKISLGQAQKARNYAADRLQLKQGMIVLDAGIGPGTMSEVLISKSTGITVVGLDASTKLLQAARSRLKPYINQVHLIRGAFEVLPFKDKCLNGIVSAYAFRDSRNRAAAIEEFHRATADDGAFAIIDLGKPDNVLRRALIMIYVRYFMPLIARLSMSPNIVGNPWRMIFPTYEALESNRDLVQSLRKQFANVNITEFGLGGLIIVFARKT